MEQSVERTDDWLIIRENGREIHIRLNKVNSFGRFSRNEESTSWITVGNSRHEFDTDVVFHAVRLHID